MIERDSLNKKLNDLGIIVNSLKLENKNLKDIIEYSKEP